MPEINETEAQRKEREEKARIARDEETARKNREEETAHTVREEQKRSYALVPAPSLDNIPEEEAQQQAKSDLTQILEAYTEKFKKKPEEEKDGTITLDFDTPEDAKNFFKEMAAKKYSFLAAEIGRDGQMNGHIMLSFGDGELHDRNIKDPKEMPAFIEKYSEYMAASPEDKADLKDALMGMLKPEPKQQHQQFREKTQQQRSEIESAESAENKSTAPTPTPRPNGS